MRRYEDDAQSAGRQHHRDGDVPGDVGENLRDARKAITCGVQRRFVHGACDDGIDLTTQREAGRGLDALRRDATGFDVTRRAILPPPAADDPDVRIERLAQRLADDFRPDPARISDGDSDARTRSGAAHDQSRMSM